MAVYVVGFVFLLALAGYSDAAYCVCNTGLSDSVLQKNIDYACGNGADCTQINQNGACYNPNTVHDHCNYAVNSYYQKKGGATGSCDFLGTATVTPTPPASASSGCVYPSGSGNAGGTTPPSTGTPTGGTPGTPAGGGTPLTPTTPNMGGTTPTPPGSFPGSGGTTTPGTPFGLGPTGSGFDGTSASPNLLSRSSTFMTIFVVSISAFVCAMI